MPILILGNPQSALQGALRLEPCRGGTAITLLACLNTPLTDREVIRLYLLCGADKPPHKISLIPTQGNEAILEDTLFIPDQYDGAAVIRCHTDTREEFVMATGFWGNPYPLSAFFQIPNPSPDNQPPCTSPPPPADQTEPAPPDPPQPDMLTRLQQNKTYRAFMDMSDQIENPIRRALDTLEALHTLRRTRSPENGIADRYFSDLKHSLLPYATRALRLPEGYHWYQVNSSEPPVALSALSHLLSSPQALFAVGKHGGYLLGINESARRIAVALPARETGACPFANADDCCVFLQSDGTVYAVVGIELAEDGQYFVPVTSIKSPDFVQDNTKQQSGEEISS